MRLRLCVYYTLFLLLFSCDKYAYAQNLPNIPKTPPNTLSGSTERASGAIGPTVTTPQSVAWLWTLLQSSLDGKMYEVYELQGQYVKLTTSQMGDTPALVFVCTGSKLMLASLRIESPPVDHIGDTGLVINLDNKQTVAKALPIRMVTPDQYIGGMDMRPMHSYVLVDLKDTTKKITKSKLAIIGYSVQGLDVIVKFDVPKIPKAMTGACGVK